MSLNLYTYAHNDPIQYTDPTGHAVAKLGTKGDTIKAIQQDLKALGYKVSTDGVFGKETEAAVKKFQKDNGLQVDGKVGNQTLTEIYFEQSKKAAKAKGIDLPEPEKQAVGQLQGNVLIISDEKYEKSIANIKEVKASTKGGSGTTDTQNNELVVTNTKVKNADPKAPDITITPKKPVRAANDTEVNALIKTTENTVTAIEKTRGTLTIASKSVDDTVTKKTSKPADTQGTSKSTSTESNVVNTWKTIAGAVRSFTYGVNTAIVQDYTYGLAPETKNDDVSNHQEAYYNGKDLGHTLTTGVLMIEGGIGAAGGFVTAPTGFGVVAGVAVVYHASSVMISSQVNSLKDEITRNQILEASSSQGGSNAPKYTTPADSPKDFTKLKNGQGWKDSDGNIWKKDMLHKDHYDISDSKGNKIKEVDFNGNEIWPNGPKNKNKKP